LAADLHGIIALSNDTYYSGHIGLQRVSREYIVYHELSRIGRLKIVHNVDLQAV